MSDKEQSDLVPEKPFYVDRAKTGRATCKKCKQKIAQGELRFAKSGYNPFGSGIMKQWHHIPCVFEVFKKQRPTSRKIENPDDIGGWEDLDENDKKEIMTYFSPELKKQFEIFPERKGNCNTSKIAIDDKNNEDNLLKTFIKLCADIANDSSYLNKTKIISDFFEKGSDGNSFKGDVLLWCKLLLPGTVLRVYNLQSKQLVKLFSRILQVDQDEMLEDLEKGDVAETISVFFKKSKAIRPADKSTLTLQEVDKFLEDLSKMTKEEEQAYHFKKLTKKCKRSDLRIILRLIKHDLRINAGPKHVLDGLHKDAYKAFQTSRDLEAVVNEVLKNQNEVKARKERGKLEIGLSMMTPILPMLAQACKSVAMALKKCPNGMFSEIKYDGERVQLHKEGNTFKYFSRSLKQVLDHKVNHFQEFIPQAFPHGRDLILDAEILMIDNETGKPLPFGTLGIHKKNEFENANVCLFVFDCMYYNGKSLLNVTIKERKDILKKNMVEVKNRIMFSEMEHINCAKDLEKMITKVFKQGLEGLVLKDVESFYEPGKRHWLKIKKDYLFGGAIADSADLVVLGAWFGTGSKGGIMSSFLMGCYDESRKKWVTVTKVSNGHDDKTLEKIQDELHNKVVKISKDPSKVPKWLDCTKTMIPDFVAVDPTKMPVWEITGAEFTCNQVHTAGGISIRFPRVTKIRKNKDWKTANTLKELSILYKKSKETADFSLKNIKKLMSDEEKEESTSSLSKKRKNDDDDDEDDDSEEISPKKAKTETDSAYLEETDEDTEEETNDSCSKTLNLPNALPDIFPGCVIQLPTDYKHNDLLRRYIIAYGGILYDREKNTSFQNSKNKITHVIHLKSTAEVKKESCWARDVCHVHINWLWDSIKLLKKQPSSKYSVKAKTGKS